LEVAFLRLLRRFRLPPSVAQHVVIDPTGGFVARVDFAYPDVRLALEADSFIWHSGGVA
jgi:hypothetical protein